MLLAHKLGNSRLVNKLEEIVSAVRNNRLNVGEMSPNEAKYCLLDPKTRNVQDLIVDDVKKAEEFLNIFMGDKVEPRRDFLLSHITETESIEEILENNSQKLG